MADPTYVLSGEQAALGPLRREYATSISAWFNDPEVRHGLAHRGLLGPDIDWAFRRAAFGIWVGPRRGIGIGSFREIGTRRGAAVTLGRRCDVVLMDAVADDFDSPALERLR